MQNVDRLLSASLTDSQPGRLQDETQLWRAGRKKCFSRRKRAADERYLRFRIRTCFQRRNTLVSKVSKKASRKSLGVGSWKVARFSDKGAKLATLLAIHSLWEGERAPPPTHTHTYTCSNFFALLSKAEASAAEGGGLIWSAGLVHDHREELFCTLLM